MASKFDARLNGTASNLWLFDLRFQGNYAIQSFERGIAALESGAFTWEIVPVEVSRVGENHPLLLIRMRAQERWFSPVQIHLSYASMALTDFLERKLSVTSLPPSSYRLGVKAANLHQLFPVHITEALQQSIVAFDKELPGFISKEALLHGVETRTSSPIRIPRDAETYESTTLKGLYPVGEGAGYAGGIISAAVDGMYANVGFVKY
ncbi:hypothetical protein K1719_041967 [Acacia pycnantha]|nr:hypothetical protein K1719_041967 [Acacia pycnantha]